MNVTARCFTCDTEISQYPPHVFQFQEFKPHFLASQDPSTSSTSSSTPLGQRSWSQQTVADQNTGKLSTVLKYFLPSVTSTSNSFRKYQRELSTNKLPLCSDCDEHVEKVQEIEKEVESLKVLINSVVGSLQFKVKSALQNHVTNQQRQRDDCHSETDSQTPREKDPTAAEETLKRLRENLLSLKDDECPVVLKDLRVSLTRINLGGCTTVKARKYDKGLKNFKFARPLKQANLARQEASGNNSEMLTRTRSRIERGKKAGKHPVNGKIEKVEVKIDNSIMNESNIPGPEYNDRLSTEGQEVPLGGDSENGKGNKSDSTTAVTTRTSGRIRKSTRKLCMDSDDEVVTKKKVGSRPGPKPNEVPGRYTGLPIVFTGDHDDDIDNVSLGDQNDDVHDRDSDWNSHDDPVHLDSEEDPEHPQEMDDGHNQHLHDQETVNMYEKNASTSSTHLPIQVPKKRKPYTKSQDKTEKVVKEKKKRVSKRDPNKPLKRILTKPPRPAVKITEIEPRVFQFEEGCQFFQREDDQFQCTTCGKAFTTRTRVVVHIRYIHLGYDLGLLGEYLCNLCGKSFNREGSLKLHEQSMHGTKSHMCSICGRLFALAGNLKSHMLIHGDQRKYVCEEENCDRKFLRKKELIYHQNKHHLNIRPHQCDQCGKTYTRHAELLLHQRSHSGQRPYQCQLCQSNFFLKARLTRHMKKVHKMFDFVPPRREETHFQILNVSGNVGNAENHQDLGHGHSVNTLNHVEFSDIQSCSDFVSSLISVHVHPAPVPQNSGASAQPHITG